MNGVGDGKMKINEPSIKRKSAINKSPKALFCHSSGWKTARTITGRNPAASHALAVNGSSRGYGVECVTSVTLAVSTTILPHIVSGSSVV